MFHAIAKVNNYNPSTNAAWTAAAAQRLAVVALVLWSCGPGMVADAVAADKPLTVGRFFDIIEDLAGDGPDALEDVDAAPRICTPTAVMAQFSCDFNAAHEYWNEQAICTNADDPDERAACRDDVAESLIEAANLCRAQTASRVALCGTFGEAGYAPQIDPSAFVDPLDIGDDVAANPYFPLVPGTRWTYQGGGEVIRVEVTNRVVEIAGVSCITVRDVVTVNGEVIEDTEDYYAQDLAGNVWYMGEIVQNFEDGRLANLDGSWIAGRDGAQPGILIFADPRVGTTHRTEFLLGEAEDVSEIISRTASETTPAAACAGDCMIVRDTTPLELGNRSLKYYKPGVGQILQVKPDGSGREELVAFTPPS
jgi:hypothetical protein